MVLNVAAVCPGTRALGPGKRFAIWVQGCCFDCPGCLSPEWRPRVLHHAVTPFRLAEEVLRIPDVEGITLSGGEPMLQARALAALVRMARRRRPLSLIVFTGFELEGLDAVPDATDLLAETDVLIAGPYVEALNDNLGMRGSSNQSIHLLTSLYRGNEGLFTSGPRSVEVHSLPEGFLAVGVPPRGFDEDFRRIIRETH